MTTSQVDTDTTSSAPPAATFDSLDPSTGEVVASHPIHSAEDVQAAVDRAQVAAHLVGGPRASPAAPSGCSGGRAC